jgi:hypothetical protein
MSLPGLVILLVIALVPLWIGAVVVGARRSDPGTCLVALIVAAFFVLLLSIFVRHGLLLSVLTSALAYALVLGVDYLRALAVAAIQLVLTWLLVVIFGAAWIGPRLVHVFRV